MAKTKTATDSSFSGDSPIPFETALERLEEITDQLESGELGLDESLRLYTEGITLAQRCNKQLGAAEEKVAKLLAADGSLVLFVGDESKLNESDAQ